MRWVLRFIISHILGETSIRGRIVLKGRDCQLMVSMKNHLTYNVRGTPLIVQTGELFYIKRTMYDPSHIMESIIT